MSEIINNVKTAISIALSEEILETDDKTAKWIAKNALKELTKATVRISDYPRRLYRK